MWDQCYFFHYSLMAAVVLRSESEVVFKVLFSLANGPILFALIMWKNSLALHDFDKSLSVFLHLTPALATWCWRWFGHDPVSVLALGAARPPHCSFTAAEGPGQGGGGGGGGGARLAGSVRCPSSILRCVAGHLLREDRGAGQGHHCG